MRNYEGEIRLQSIGIVDGIKAKNLVVGDILVWNFGGTEEVIKIEPSKTGKTVNVTIKYYSEHSRIVDGKWIGEWIESVRKLGSERIVAVQELNPVVEIEEESKEVEIVVETPAVEEVEQPQQEMKEVENTTDQTQTTHFTISEDTHTKTGAKIFVAKLTEKVEYEEFKSIESTIKTIDGYYSRFKKGFIFNEDPTNILNETFNSSEYNETKTNSAINEDIVTIKEVKEIEINIDNINAENFPISKEISDRENSGHWTFRIKERNHQQEILNYLQNFQDTFMGDLNKLENNSSKNNYKRWLNNFKKRYYENYYKRLRNDANNPSWITTGRDGRNARKDAKMNSRHDNLMRECCSLDEEFKKKLSEIKVKIRKENDKKFSDAVLSNKKEYEYKRIKKEINLSTVNNYFEGNNLIEKNCYITIVNGQEFYIINVWSRFVAVNSKGQEIGKASCQTLKDAKTILNYYLAEYEKSELNIAM